MPAPSFTKEEQTNVVLPIESVEEIRFTTTSNVERDDEGHVHPGEEHEVTKTMTRITTEDGHEGYCFGDLNGAESLLEDILVGRDALNHEAIWQKLVRSQRVNNRALHEETIAAVDLALWDLVGRYMDLPVNKILGATRERVPAYASTMIADEDKGLDSPEAFADFAEECQDRGFPAFKLHTWFPPIDQDWERDAAACRAVRERVGPDMDLMLDCSAHYRRMEALELGKVLDELDFHWYEEMMHEQSMSAYQWLREKVDVPIAGPETQAAWGKMGIRAEWIKHGACDVCRTGVWDVGGITPVLKTVGLCESFEIPLELHGGGAAHLQILGAMGIPGEYYEFGLIHPELDWEGAPDYLNQPIDPVDDDGHVPVPQRPGLGYDIDWDYIHDNRVEEA